MWNVHTALAGTSHLPDVPGKYPFVVDYFIILKTHSISGADARLRNLNVFCNFHYCKALR